MPELAVPHSTAFGFSRSKSEASNNREKSDGDEDLGDPDHGKVKPRRAKEDGNERTKPEEDAAGASPEQHSARRDRGGACSILFGLGSLVAILLRTTRFDLPVIRIAEVFIAVGLLSIVAGLVLRAREAKSS